MIAVRAKTEGQVRLRISEPHKWLRQRYVTGYDGYVDVEFLGGRSSLDYIGTVRWRRSDKPHDYLAGPSDLAEWATMSGLMDEPPRVTSAQLDVARGLREVIYRVVYGRLVGDTLSVSDVAAINLAAGRVPVEISLDADGCVHRAGTVAQLLGSVARDALDLMGSDQLDLVRECDGAGCTRLYVDSSRARNRRWCSNACLWQPSEGRRVPRARSALGRDGVTDRESRSALVGA